MQISKSSKELSSLCCVSDVVGGGWCFHLQAETASYFVASKHKLSVFFALIFRFSSCQHPLLASALAKMSQDVSNRAVIGKDESALRQLLSMMLSDNHHVVSQ